MEEYASVRVGGDSTLLEVYGKNETVTNDYSKPLVVTLKPLETLVIEATPVNEQNHKARIYRALFTRSFTSLLCHQHNTTPGFIRRQAPNLRFRNAFTVIANTLSIIGRGENQEPARENYFSLFSNAYLYKAFFFTP